MDTRRHHKTGEENNRLRIIRYNGKRLGKNTLLTIIYNNKLVMHKLFYITSIVLLFVVSCSVDVNMGDFEKKLAGGYILSRESEDVVEIFNFEDSKHLGVASKVVAIAWNPKFIFAKRQKLANRGNFPGDDLPIPVPGQFDYWIIDLTHTNRMGPLTESEFTNKSASLGFSKLNLQPSDNNAKSMK